MAAVHLSRKSSVADELRDLHSRIAQRAYALFQRRNGDGVDPIGDWLSAERELIWKPSLDVRERDGGFVVEAKMPGVDAADIAVDVSPEEIIVRGSTERHAAGESRGVQRSDAVVAEAFSSIALSKPIDVGATKAAFKNGTLRITAPFADRGMRRHALGSA